MKNPGKTQHFTLVEILVAVAVLLLLMSFLLQFTAGAQRIWSGAAGRNTISAEADAIFALIQKDLKRMYITSEPDFRTEWCANKGHYNTDFCFFIINTDLDDNLSAVRYHKEKTDGSEETYSLYRFIQENAWNNAGKTTQYTPNDFVSTPVYDDNHCIISNLKDFEIVLPSDSVTTEKPLWVKVIMTLRVPENLRNNSAGGDEKRYERSFSRMFFLK